MTASFHAMSDDVFVCDGARTPVGRYGGSLSGVRPDDLAAVVLRAIRERNDGVDWTAVDDLIMGCANQAGEDNRNVARMASLLAGFPTEVPAHTVNRLCASGMTSIGNAAAMIASGMGELYVAGGVESMSRAPMVVGKSTKAFDRTAQMFDTTIGWRFVNPALKEAYGTDSMPETAQNLADDYNISREEQDAFALWSQTKAAAAIAAGAFSDEIVPVEVVERRSTTIVDTDEHPRKSSPEALAKLRAIVPDGSITAGNASGINDGAAAVLLASADAVEKYGLTPLAKITASAAAGVEPRVMGIGPVFATRKVLAKTGLSMDDFDLIEINEAFAAQVLACTRQLGIADDDPRINPLGGGIALGHPLGMSGARLIVTAVRQLQASGKDRALATMCIGVGQGTAMIVERV